MAIERLSYSSYLTVHICSPSHVEGYSVRCVMRMEECLCAHLKHNYHLNVYNTYRAYWGPSLFDRKNRFSMQGIQNKYGVQFCCLKKYNDV